MPDNHPLRSRLVIYAAYVVLLGTAAVAGIPFIVSGQLNWLDLRVPLLVGTVALVAATFLQLRLMGFAWPACLWLFTVVFGVSWAAEWSGIRWGQPFGQPYHYHPEVLPVLPGGVPVFIPLAWFVLAAAPLSMLRVRSWRNGSGAGGRGRLLRQAAICALFLPACNLLLEPLSLSAELWTWQKGGACFGAPLQNLGGWFLVGFVACLFYFLAAGRREPAGAPPQRAFELIWLTATAGFLGTACVVAWLRLTDLTPAIAACAGIVPYLAWGYVGAFRGDAVEDSGSSSFAPGP